MPAKEVRFHEGARAKMVHGLNILADAVKVEGTEYLVMREDDIMGVIEGA